VETRAVRGLGEFLERRTRWASKITRYPSAGAVGLLGVFFFYFLAIPLWIVGMAVAGWGITPLLAGLGAKIAGDALLTFRGLLNAGKPAPMLVFPVAELFHIPYIILVSLRGMFGTFVWRGRLASATNPEDSPPRPPSLTN
jgi:hypothetical protein